MEISKEELKQIKDYLKNEYPNTRAWRFSGNTIVSDKVLLKDDKWQVYSYVHVHEGEKHKSVYMAVCAHPTDWEKSSKTDKLDIHINVLSLEQLKEAEGKANELLTMAKKMNVWK